MKPQRSLVLPSSFQVGVLLTVVILICAVGAVAAQPLHPEPASCTFPASLR